jgi:hypothetical protein
MSTRADYLEGLLDLPGYAERPTRRAVFRQSAAALALAASVDGPSPLDGIRPEALLRSVRVAIADGLLDDLSWLAASAAAVVVYEIAAALPLGPERRDLGRRVLGQLYEGNAATFTAVATRMASGSARGLGGAGVRARVTIAMALPSSVHIPVDSLALALASRRELARDWIAAPSMGSLTERRLAGRVIERAAREAVRRAMQGDDNPARLFRNAITALSQRRRSAPPSAGADPITSALTRLLADRETLVWRHVAAARGLLAGISPELTTEIGAELGTDLTPTEWRRAATSLVASIAIDPDRALTRSMDLLSSPLLSKDPAIATAMIWGLRCAADLEPEAAEELLNAITRAAPIPVAESVAELRNELGAFGSRAAEQSAKALAGLLGKPEPDDGLAALARSILRDLSSDPGEGSDLSAALRGAVNAFVDTAAREAHTQALRALALATETVTALEALEVNDEPTAQSSMSRRTATGLLRELDAHMLESGLLKSLLLLDRPPSAEVGDVGPVDDIEERLATWLIRTEADPSPPGRPPAHVTLLHLIDAEASEASEEPDRRTRVRRRWSSASNVLLERLATERTIQLRRALAATVARALDALVRDSAADAADVLLSIAARVADPNDLDVLAEASMHPDVTQLVHAYARFVRKVDAPPPLSAPPSVYSGDLPKTDPGIEALDALVTELPTGATQRVEVLRGALSRLTKSLSAVRTAASLYVLATPLADAPSPLAALDEALGKLTQFTAGARRRCGEDLDDDVPRFSETPSRISQLAQRAEGYLLASLRRALQSQGDVNLQELGPLVDDAIDTIERALPPAIAALVAARLKLIPTLPLERPSAPNLAPSVQEQALPAWLPTRRIIGGFYVQRQLGGGSLGTVFVVTRAEERHDPDAERLALKVPDYDATAARSVSEADFLKLFREEAGALLSVPEHRNLARFVTFDAGARPKPILVMELIEGIRCDNLIASRKLSTRGALSLLDGVLAGLEAMHSVEVGHLDIKPSNVVLRGGTEPVLVDFGLAGRHIRPGCATTAYGAPEVWGIIPEGVTPTPLTADVYSFGCLAYEVLTGDILFDDKSDIATISSHLTHDGLPGRVRAMSERPELEPLAMFLFHCLRHSPKDRWSVPDLREELASLSAHLHNVRWPIDPG